MILAGFGRPARADVAGESNAQLALFDGLGPLARAAFNDMPRNPDLKAFLYDFRKPLVLEWFDKFDRPPPPLTDTEIDKRFAAYLDRKVEQLTGHPIAWHVLKPLRPLPLKLLRQQWRGPRTASRAGRSAS